MKKTEQSPGAAIKAMLDKYGLNCNRLAKAINMSNAMVRLLVLDKSPISVSAAYRLAKFFNNKAEYWLNVQMNYDMEKVSKDKALAKEIAAITDVSQYEFVRKPHAPKTEKDKAGKDKAGKKKAAASDKRKAAKKTPGAKPARGAAKQ